MSKFEYVRLSLTEIVTILRESQIANVTEDDLKKPTSDLVTDLYTRLLFYLDVLHEEDEGLIEFAHLEQLDNPDLYGDSFRVLKLCQRISVVLSSVDCPVQFILKDLLRPDANNTDIFLSAILNYYLYKVSKMNDLKPISDELILIHEQQEEWQAKISQLNADISSYYEARERELPFVQEIVAKVEELRQTIAGLNSHQMSLRASLRKLKDKNGEMSEKISRADFELVQSVQENATLQNKIVQSPEKLQRILEEKKSVREGAKNYERSAAQFLREKDALLEVYSKAIKKTSKHLDRMQNLQEQVNSIKSKEKENKALKAKLIDAIALNKSQKAKLLERQAKAEQLEALIIQLEKERDLEIKEVNTELNKVKSEVESRRCDLEARQRNVEAVIAEVGAIKARKNFVKESVEAKVQELTRKCEEVMEQFHRYSDSLSQLFPMADELVSSAGA